MNARRLLLIPALMAAVGAGVASASVLVPAPAAPVSDSSGPSEVPGPAPAVVAATTPDPSGGSWGVRVYRSQTGQTCPTPGRLSLGRFGRYGSDGTFQELPLAAAGACADLTKGGAALAVQRIPAQGLRPARTLIYGTTAAATDRVVLHDAGGTRQVASDGGTFLIVRANSDLSGVSLDVVSAGGQTQTVALAASSTDPG